MSAKPLSFSRPSGRMVSPLSVYVAGWAAGQAGRHHAVRADDRDVDRQMMPAELDHPRGRRGRRAEDRQVVLVLSEDNPASASATRRSAASSGRGARTAAGPSASLILEHLVAVHDLGDLVVAVSTEHRGHQRERGLALGGGHVAQPQALALKDPTGKIGPVDLLGAVEWKQRPGALIRVQPFQEGVGGRHCSRQDAGRRHRRGRRRRTLALRGGRRNGDGADPRERDKGKRDLGCRHSPLVYRARGGSIWTSHRWIRRDR